MLDILVSTAGSVVAYLQQLISVSAFEILEMLSVYLMKNTSMDVAVTHGGHSITQSHSGWLTHGVAQRSWNWRIFNAAA